MVEFVPLASLLRGKGGGSVTERAEVLFLRAGKSGKASSEAESVERWTCADCQNPMSESAGVFGRRGRILGIRWNSGKLPDLMPEPAHPHPPPNGIPSWARGAVDWTDGAVGDVIGKERFRDL